MTHRSLFLGFLFLAATFTMAARSFDNESLRYKVLYRWGLINKTAGYADIRMLPGGGEMCYAQLTAASEPWADKFYKVRDTLKTTMHRADFSPSYYEKLYTQSMEER